MSFIKITMNAMNATEAMQPIARNLITPLGKALNTTVNLYGVSSTSYRTYKAWEEYKKGNRSLRNPKFWLRTASAVSTGTGALVHGIDSVAKLAGSKSEWPTLIAAGLTSFGDCIDHKFTMKSALF